ncbi:Transcription factor GAMYB [Acorus calamus]|uniref:Transcription factor GAMYB n=1 Tax=Acorus calamus TaxID=4465 RepID=A0AAV9C7L4_ACOCL|nr:Transcription factor GAMYB [Acorus calamus]
MDTPVGKIRCSMGKGDQGVVFMRKRSAWTAAEDDILKNYVKIHGAHQWKEVEKMTGLKRSGKSCWLRWKDHLQPGLNKAKLSEEEKELINRLQAQYGNKWSTIASQMK